MNGTKNWTKWIYWFSLGVAIILIYKTVDSFEDIAMSFGKLMAVIKPFIIAVLVAYIFYIPCRYIEKLYKKLKMPHRLARLLSTLTVYVLAIFLIILSLNIILPAVSASVKDLASNLPTYYRNAITYVEEMPEDSIIKKETIQSIIADLEAIDITQFFTMERITDYINGLFGLANSIFGLVITIIVSIYMLLERTKMLEFLSRLNRALFKEKTSKAISKYCCAGNDMFFKFIFAQVLDSIIVGTVAGIIMWIMGVKYGVLLALMFGLFNMIPMIGSIVATIIAVLITMFTGGFTQAFWLLIITIIYQQIDANIVNPRLIGSMVKISPIIIILGVTIGGSFFGILGMLLSVPVIAVVKMIIEDYIAYRLEAKATVDT